jgi:hypothetical protein
MYSSLFEVDAAWYSLVQKVLKYTELQDVQLTPDANLNHHVKILPRYLGKTSRAKQSHWIYRLPSQGTIQGLWKGTRKS